MPAPVAVSEFSIHVDQIQDYEFRVKFDKESHADLLVDEPPPLGRDRGPSASRLLAAAVGNCLSASLLFCARKARVNLEGVHTLVKTQIVRGDSGRLRIGKIDVEIDPEFTPTDEGQAARCLAIFEDYCTVTASVRQGIPINVKVKGAPARD